MTLNLDPETVNLIQQEIDLGRFTEPGEVVKRAIERMAADDSWSDEEKAELDRSYDEGMAACARGEGTPADKVREVLARRRLARAG